MPRQTEDMKHECPADCEYVDSEQRIRLNAGTLLDYDVAKGVWQLEVVFASGGGILPITYCPFCGEKLPCPE